VDYRYVALTVPVGEVGEALAFLLERGYRGINVTVPHKEEVLAWVPSVDAFARKVNAVNTIDLFNGHGINTDGTGFVKTIEEIDGDVLVLGAGGSARSIVGALSEAGRNVRVWNRTSSRAVELARQWRRVTAEPEIRVDQAAIIVNATSSTLANSDLEIPWKSADPSAVAYDLMYGGAESGFLRDAREAGHRTIDGREMLAAQGALAFEYWLGEFPLEIMRRALGL
jgi:shikimate dehydrogenase